VMLCRNAPIIRKRSEQAGRVKSHGGVFENRL